MKRQRGDDEAGVFEDSDYDSDDDALIESIYKKCMEAEGKVVVVEEGRECGLDENGPEDSGSTASIPQAIHGDETAVDGLKRLKMEDWPHRIIVRGKHTVTFGDFIVCSEESVEKLSKTKWRWSKDGYVKGNVRLDDGTVAQGVMMGRYLMDTPPDLLADHVDTNKWDHRMESLENVTHEQSAQNRAKQPGKSSKFSGVWKEKSGMFVAYMTINGKRLRLGQFPTQEEAAVVYDTYLAQKKVEKKLKFRLNFPDKETYYKSLPTYVIAAKKPTKTGFSFVQQDGNKFYSHMVFAGKLYFKSGFDTAQDAARESDRVIVEKGWSKKLNFPEEHLDYVPTRKVRHTMIEITNDDHIRDILAEIGVSYDDVDSEIDCLVKIKGKHGYSLLQKVDFDSISTLSMYVDDGYVHVVTTSPKKKMGLNRYLFQPLKKGLMVDHTESNKRDNRRRFLNPTTPKGNSDNSKKRRRGGYSDSDFIGVSKDNAKWRASISTNGKRIFDCRYADEVNATRARDLFVRAKHPSSRLNFKDWKDPAVLAEWTKKLNSNNELF